MSSNIKKILLLTNQIPEYRIPVFNELGKIYNLTVAHFDKKCSETDTFFDEIILTKKQFGSFVFFKDNIYKLASNYDVVVAIGDLHIIPYISLGFRHKRKFSLTFWGLLSTSALQHI